MLLTKEQRVFHEVDKRCVDVSCLTQCKVQVELFLVSEAPDKDVIEVSIDVRIIRGVIGKH